MSSYANRHSELLYRLDIRSFQCSVFFHITATHFLNFFSASILYRKPSMSLQGDGTESKPIMLADDDSSDEIEILGIDGNDACCLANTGKTKTVPPFPIPSPKPPPPAPHGALELTACGVRSHYVLRKNLPASGAIISHNYFEREGFTLVHEVHSKFQVNPNYEFETLPIDFLENADEMKYFKVTKIELYYSRMRFRWEKLITWHPADCKVTYSGLGLEFYRP